VNVCGLNIVVEETAIGCGETPIETGMGCGETPMETGIGCGETPMETGMGWGETPMETGIGCGETPISIMGCGEEVSIETGAIYIPGLIVDSGEPAASGTLSITLGICEAGTAVSRPVPTRAKFVSMVSFDTSSGCRALHP
jgi:hypothetical protein